MGLIVQKFGGTSVANAERLRNVAEIIAETYRQGNQVVAVLSAQGDTTDDLIEKAQEINPKASRREMDMLLSTGEQISCSLCAMAVEALGLPVVSLTGWQAGVQTNSSYSSARIKKIDVERIQSEIDRNHSIVIVTGFQGINKYDDITTLGRGGSDTTAVALAAELHADVCEIYTDVDGVYTADPRIVPNARKMEEVTYDEMLEMASLGAKVLHSRCVEIAKKYGVELLVCSSLNRNSGTMVREKTKMEKMLISGVAADKNVAKIRVAGLGNDPESTFRLLNLLDRNNLNIDVMIQSLGKDGTKSVSFTVAKPDMLRTIDVLNDNKDSLGIKKLDYDENVAKISVIGAGVRSHSGVAAKMFGALANAGINTEMITTSEIRITALIDEAYADQAMRAIHETFLERV